MAISSDKGGLSALLKAALDALPDGVAIMDPSGRLVFANEPRLRAMGYGSLEEAQGAPWDKLTEHLEIFDEAGRDVPPSNVPAAKVLRGDPEASALLRIRSRKTGSEGWYEVRAVPFHVEESGVRYVADCSQDVTKAGTRRNTLRPDEGRAHRDPHPIWKIDALGTLAGGVAHDFNNLLTAINGYSDLILHEISADSRLGRLNDYVLEIRKAGESAAKVTQRLLAYGRRQILKPQASDLNGIVVSMACMLQEVATGRNEIVFGLETLVGTIQVDIRQMESVILNLVMNARDAMPVGGTIGIHTLSIQFEAPQETFDVQMPPGRYAMLEVSDSGIGMSPITKSRIFEPFFTTKKMGKGIGLGLGLSTVQGIIRQSGGFIQVFSEEGVGSRFRIFLPVSDANDANQPASGSRSPEGRPARKETLLLVEDGDFVRKYTRELLVRAGYHVLEAENGQEAIDLCNDFGSRIDLLLTDVLMPGMSGPDLAARLTQSRIGLKVLFMSGYADVSAFSQDSVDVGRSLLLKPFSSKALLDSIEQALSGA